MLQIPGSCLEKVKKHHYACSLQVLVSFKAFNFFNLMNRKNMWPCLFTSCDTVGAVCKSQKAINEKMVYTDKERDTYESYEEWNMNF